jgi:hypothetical protein
MFSHMTFVRSICSGCCAMLFCNGGSPDVCVSVGYNGYNTRNRHHGPGWALGTRLKSVRDVPEVDLVNVFGIFLARKFRISVARPVPQSHVHCGKDSWSCSLGPPSGPLVHAQTSPKSVRNVPKIPPVHIFNIFLGRKLRNGILR